MQHSRIVWVRIMHKHLPATDGVDVSTQAVSRSRLIQYLGTGKVKRKDSHGLQRGTKDEQIHHIDLLFPCTFNLTLLTWMLKLTLPT